MKETILITGYNGFLANHISNHLRQQGYLIKGLSHRKNNNASDTYYWNIQENYMDERALENVDYIIHLAGAGIADKRWTKKRKKEIIDSRIQSAALLASVLKRRDQKIKGLVGVSAVGYYGAQTTERTFTENDLPGNDFLADCCVQWENSYNLFDELVERKIILRLGTVIGKDGGAIKKLIPLVKLGLGSPLGSGKQIMPFIYVKDLCRLFEHCISNKNISGLFNAVAPEQPPNKTFMKTLATSLHKPFFMPSVPSFLLKIILGEMAAMLLEGSKVSDQKIRHTGFNFLFPTLTDTFKEL